jgi:HSP20 family molecular chaperone IbpA
VDYDYSKRGYLLPIGCKDLIDVIQPKKGIARDYFFVTIQLPGLKNADIQIWVEGNTLRIIAKAAAGNAQCERKIEVPTGFEIAKTRAIYLKDRLCITVPKAPTFPHSL